MITIIDYGLGNLGSVKNALDTLGVKSVISGDPVVISQADKLILPGVGAAGQGMKNLKERNLIKVIRAEIRKKKPVLGICLGMQLLLSQSEEGDVRCLDIIKGDVKLFKIKEKVPQIGWNQVQIINSQLSISNLFIDVSDNSYFYFVHSYYCQPEDTNVVAGVTNYGNSFCSVIVKENIYATQFHPEKSGDAGLQLLTNFCTHCNSDALEQ